MQRYGRLLAVMFGFVFFSVPFALAFAQTAPSVTVQSLSPGGTVNPGTEVSFTIISSGLNNPTYSVIDSLSGSSVTNGDINSSGVFTWFPNNGDGGTHTLTVTATDSSGSPSASAVVQINVNAPPSVTITSLSPANGTVAAGTLVSFSVAAINFTNPSYAVTDSFSGGSLTTGAVNSSGNFTWTPIAQDVGTHTITVTVTDSLGHSASATQTITVTPVLSVSIVSLAPGTTTTFGTPVTFTINTTGFTNPAFSLGDSVATSLSNSNINSSGYFSWTPVIGDIGTHNIVIFVTDSQGHSANVAQQIVVQSAGLSIQSLAPGGVVTAGTPVSFTTLTSGFVSPITYVLGDSFGAATTITSTNISSTTGLFTWTPDTTQVGVHTISVYAADSAGHTGSAAVSIVVNPATTTSITTSGVTSTSGVTNSTTASVSSYVFTAYLAPGSTGPDVTALQNILVQEGYLSTAATGYYGSLTEAAVKQFQAAHGIEQLGAVGPATRATLNGLGGTASGSSSTATPPATAANATTTTAGDGFQFTNTLDVGSTGTDVTELQKRLTAEGVYGGPITGYFGALTQAAVEAYQGKHGIAQVGTVGPMTRAALNGH